MQNTITSEILKDKIKQLEIEHIILGEQLKDQLHITYESIKPVNLFKQSIANASPLLIDNLIGNMLGVATGYISKKVVIGSSHNILQKFFGSMIQMSVSNAVAQNPNAIITVSKLIFQSILNKIRKSDKK